MIRNKLIFILLTVTTVLANAQQTEKDSLLAVINKHNGDTAEVNALSYLGANETQTDSMTKYAAQGLALSEKIDYKKGQANCYLAFANISTDVSRAIQFALDALSIFKKINDYTGIATACLFLQASCRDEIAEYRSSLNFALEGKQVAEAHNPKIFLWLKFKGHRILPLLLGEIAQTYVLMNQPDSALIYTRKCLEEKELFNGGEYEFGIYLLAYIQNLQGKYDEALKNYRKALPLAIQDGFPSDTLQIFSGMSSLFKNTGHLDSCIYYAQVVAQKWTSDQSEYKNLFEALKNLAQAYKLQGETDSALKYTEISLAIRDSIFTNDKAREIQKIAYENNLKQQELITVQLTYKSNVLLYTLSAGILLTLLAAGFLLRNNRQKQKAKEKIEKAYSELESAQKQLIQSEKMASLGELTAGIAHEIQNPLNFVNNFSEVNKELVEELKGERQKAEGVRNTAFEDELIADIDTNSEKINYHGKRADAIVKGMLQHSRSGTGVKEPADINALADEYLRLSYHGIRAKDKDFNAILKTEFDEAIGKINIVPQDIGRVLLNLYNNAFYAVAEQKKRLGVSYEPLIFVCTKKIGDKVEISVADNGSGIPQNVVDKIFQPFFTTKPAGQGTGLGLSLSYDIIKAHGGEIKVETKQGTGTTFIIHLPA